jgi:hypothetical protein
MKRSPAGGHQSASRAPTRSEDVRASQERQAGGERLLASGG